VVPWTLSPAGTFLRGVLDKVGVEPQVQRIGAYKSAGDQLLRRDMSDAQREQLGELLDDIYENFLDTVAEARGKTREVGLSGCVTWAS
jgi:protease-4